MIATEILPRGVEQANHDRWLKVRRGGIGGSDASAVLGINPHRTPFEVWLSKLGRLPESADSEAAAWGHRLEPVLIEHLAEVAGVTITTTYGTLQGVHEWMRYNPDGIVLDGDGKPCGIAEIKTTTVWLAAEWDATVDNPDGVPVNALCQVQWGMLVTGLRRAWVGALIGGQQFRWRCVEYNPELCGLLLDAATRFWHDHVLADVEPPIDARDLDTLTALYPDVAHDTVDRDDAETLWAAYQEATAAAKAAATARDTAKAQLIAAMGDAASLVHGDREYATRRTQTATRVDLDALRAEHPDVVAAHTHTTTTRVLRTKKAPTLRKDLPHE